MNTTSLSNNRVKAKIFHFTAITQDAQNELIFERGIEYLTTYTEGIENWRKILETSKLFWMWWTNQWNIRDEEFVRAMEGCRIKLTAELYGKIYDSMHHAPSLAKEIMPPKVVYETANNSN